MKVFTVKLKMYQFLAPNGATGIDVQKFPCPKAFIYRGASVAHGNLIMICLKNQIVNLGGNRYYLCSLFGTFSGFLFLILLAVLIERTAILDDFLSYCGKESLLIVIFHNIDILIARNWSMRDNSFLFGTYLLYPFLAYILKRFRSAGKSYVNNTEASKSKVPF